MKCDQCENEATVHEVTVRAGVRMERHLCERCARQIGISSQPHVPLSELLTKYVLETVSGQSSAKAGPASTATVCPSCQLTWNEFRQVDRLGCPQCYRVFEQLLSPMIERAHEGATHHRGKVPKQWSARSAGSASAPDESSGASTPGASVSGKAGPKPDAPSSAKPASAKFAPASGEPSVAKAGVSNIGGGATGEDLDERLSALRRQLAQAVRAEQYEKAAQLRDAIKRLSEGREAGG
jgi:protein arginine kinase activator